MEIIKDANSIKTWVGIKQIFFWTYEIDNKWFIVSEKNGGFIDVDIIRLDFLVRLDDIVDLDLGGHLPKYIDDINYEEIIDELEQTLNNDMNSLNLCFSHSDYIFIKYWKLNENSYFFFKETYFEQYSNLKRKVKIGLIKQKLTMI
jgi:hypothetical protein